jgi:hypothetical protein
MVIVCVAAETIGLTEVIAGVSGTVTVTVRMLEVEEG